MASARSNSLYGAPSTKLTLRGRHFRNHANKYSSEVLDRQLA